MTENKLKLGEDDIRAQEMIFWLKKLSLEIPEAVRPALDLSAITTLIAAQTERIELLEEHVRSQSASLESLRRTMKAQCDTLEDIQGHLYRLGNSQVYHAYPDTFKFKHSSSSQEHWTSTETSQTKSEKAERLSRQVGKRNTKHDTTIESASQSTPENTTSRDEPLANMPNRKRRLISVEVCETPVAVESQKLVGAATSDSATNKLLQLAKSETSLIPSDAGQSSSAQHESGTSGKCPQSSDESECSNLPPIPAVQPKQYMRRILMSDDPMDVQASLGHATTGIFGSPEI